MEVNFFTMNTASISCQQLSLSDNELQWLLREVQAWLVGAPFIHYILFHRLYIYLNHKRFNIHNKPQYVFLPIYYYYIYVYVRACVLWPCSFTARTVTSSTMHKRHNI